MLFFSTGFFRFTGLFIKFLIQHLGKSRHNCGILRLLLKHRGKRLSLLNIAFLCGVVKHLRENALRKELKVRSLSVLLELLVSYKLVMQGCYDNLVGFGELTAEKHIYLVDDLFKRFLLFGDRFALAFYGNILARCVNELDIAFEGLLQLVEFKLQGSVKVKGLFRLRRQELDEI